MRLSPLVIFVFPLIAVATPAVPNIAENGLSKKNVDESTCYWVEGICV